MSYCTLDENIAPGTCPKCEAELAALRAVVTAAEEVAAALEAMGAERQENFGTPQVVRDLCRHQAARLRAALKVCDECNR